MIALRRILCSKAVSSHKKHTEEKCKSASKILNLLRRNLHFAPPSVKAKAYFACVRPILEYGNICWSPTSAKSNKCIEMIQHTAAKFVTNSYPKKGHYEQFSITKLLNDLQWTTLEERRKHAKLSMVYKILNSHVKLPSNTLPRVKNTRSPRSCNQVYVGLKNQLVERKSSLIPTRETFYYSAPTLWNNMVSPEQAVAPSIDAFKEHFLR